MKEWDSWMHYHDKWPLFPKESMGWCSTIANNMLFAHIYQLREVKGARGIWHILVNFRIHTTGHENINNLLHYCTMAAWMYWCMLPCHVWVVLNSHLQMQNLRMYLKLPFPPLSMWTSEKINTILDQYTTLNLLPQYKQIQVCAGVTLLQNIIGIESVTYCFASMVLTDILQHKLRL